jgi:hypothetical protein
VQLWHDRWPDSGKRVTANRAKLRAGEGDDNARPR